MPEHLRPQAQMLNKATKQQMWLLHQRARGLATAQSSEELDQITNDLIKLQNREAEKLQGLKKASGESSFGSKPEGACAPRTPFRGKHRSASVPAQGKKETKGTPAGGAETGSLVDPATSAATDGDGEDDTTMDEVPDWGSAEPEEGCKQERVVKVGQGIEEGKKKGGH